MPKLFYLVSILKFSCSPTRESHHQTAGSQAFQTVWSPELLYILFPDIMRREKSYLVLSWGPRTMMVLKIWDNYRAVSRTGWFDGVPHCSEGFLANVLCSHSHMANTKHVRNKYFVNKWLHGINEKETSSNVDMEFSKFAALISDVT